LLLTIIAGAVLGAERSKSGHAAGLRTTLLVTLAASISMIQMNLLIQTNGKPHDSYAVMDLMRLPLGILTGVGFIGAGAIVKKGEMVVGVTTAATMWFRDSRWIVPRRRPTCAWRIVNVDWVSGSLGSSLW
jgi:putative Mg2+ transporter-C (MgtC) family protein